MQVWLAGNDQRPSVDEALATWSPNLATRAYEPEDGWSDDDGSDDSGWAAMMAGLLAEEEEMAFANFAIPYADSSSSEDDGVA